MQNEPNEPNSHGPDPSAKASKTVGKVQDDAHRGDFGDASLSSPAIGAAPNKRPDAILVAIKNAREITSCEDQQVASGGVSIECSEDVASKNYGDVGECENPDQLDASGVAEISKNLAAVASAEPASGGNTTGPHGVPVTPPVLSSSLPDAERYPEPLPLMREQEGAEPVPLEHLGPFLPAVEAIGTLTQAPPAIAMQSIFGAACLAVQGFANVETLAGPVPVSLAFLTVAQSGERKSACDKLALSSIRDIEQERVRKFLTAYQEYELLLEAYENDRKAILRNRDVFERDTDLEALGPPPSPPLTPHILLGDPTVEGLLRAFEEGQPSVGLFSDEGGLLFGGHAMNSDNKLKTSAAISKLWDGSEINRTRASARTTTYYHRRLTCHIMVQPLVADKLLRDPTIRDQGLLSRMLLSYPESRIGYRTEASDEDQKDAKRALGSFHDDIRRILDIPLPTGPDPRELAPRLLPLSADARNLLRSFAEVVETAQRAGGPCAGIQGFASKAAEQAARFAGVMTLFENPDADQVEAEQMIAATGLMDWYLREARRLLDSGPINQKSRDAEKLRLWLVESRSEDEINIRTVVQRGPRQLRDTAVIRSLFEVLENHGWLVPIPGPRGRQKWRIVRT